jgi:hypothetical protein
LQNVDKLLTVLAGNKRSFAARLLIRLQTGQLPKLYVVGSIPIARSTLNNQFRGLRGAGPRRACDL